MSQVPAGSLGTLDSYASSIPALHRVQELNLEEKQLQLDQEVRGYMNREGKTSRGWGLREPCDLGDRPGSPLLREPLRQFRRKPEDWAPGSYYAFGSELHVVAFIQNVLCKWCCCETV